MCAPLDHMKLTVNWLRLQFDKSFLRELPYVSFTLRTWFSLPFFLLTSTCPVLSDPIDIDQLMRIMALTGTPSVELLVKLGSDEVSQVHLF